MTKGGEEKEDQISKSKEQKGGAAREEWVGRIGLVGRVGQGGLMGAEAWGAGEGGRGGGGGGGGGGKEHPKNRVGGLRGGGGLGGGGGIFCVKFSVACC